MSETPQTPATSLPPENVPRATLLTLLIIPAGIIVWVIIWSVGFVASIVALGVAIGALALYRLGSGGRVSRTGAIRVTVITIITLLLSFAAGIVADNLPYFAKAFQLGRVFEAFSAQIAAAPGEYAVSFGLALVFGALGCFSVLRTAFAQSAAQPAPVAEAAPLVEPGPDVEPGKRD